MTSRTARTASLATAAAVAGAALVIAPASTGPASATSSVKVKKQATADKLRQHVVNIAKSKVGRSYSLGSTGPNSFDCSGLVVYSYKRATGKTLPRTSYSQTSAVRHVSARNRKPGDIVFFRGRGHVAIYIGNNKLVHASNSRRGVRIDRMQGYYRTQVVGYGRVIEKR